MVKKRALINSLLIISIILAGVGLGYGLSKMAAAKRKADMVRAVTPGATTVVDNRSLQERAKAAKRYVSEQAPSKGDTFADLDGLAKSSSAVIVGIPQDNLSALSADGKSITIDYKVQVMYVYKGGLREGSTITVSLPGGKVAFADGSTAEIKTPWFKKMMNGKTYILFLTATARSDQFVATGEAQGVFEIPQEMKDKMIVQPSTGLPNDPVAKYGRMDAREFLKEVRRATGKAKTKA